MEETKLIRVDNETHEIIRLEAVRQSLRPNTAVSMGDIIKQLAKKLQKSKSK
jgi:hypothetical protein